MNGEQAMSPQTGEPMRCPSCGNRLIEVERSSVLIDACPSCRGVWLDRGELDKILVQERQMAVGDPDDDFLREVEGRRGSGRDPRERGDERDSRSGHGGGHHDKAKRRRGRLEDLFDFG